jgi:hypothetical protein
MPSLFSIARAVILPYSRQKLSEQKFKLAKV